MSRIIFVIFMLFSLSVEGTSQRFYLYRIEIVNVCDAPITVSAVNYTHYMGSNSFSDRGKDLHFRLGVGERERFAYFSLSSDDMDFAYVFKGDDAPDFKLTVSDGDKRKTFIGDDIFYLAKKSSDTSVELSEKSICP